MNFSWPESAFLTPPSGFGWLEWADWRNGRFRRRDFLPAHPLLSVRFPPLPARPLQLVLVALCLLEFGINSLVLWSQSLIDFKYHRSLHSLGRWMTSPISTQLNLRRQVFRQHYGDSALLSSPKMKLRN